MFNPVLSIGILGRISPRYGFAIGVGPEEKFLRAVAEKEFLVLARLKGCFDRSVGKGRPDAPVGNEFLSISKSFTVHGVSL